MARPKKETPQDPLEKQLWSAADKLRKNIDAAEYKHVVLGLIFLKYISDSFEGLFVRLQEGKGEFEGADPEDRDEYTAKNVFFVPQPARWNWLRDNAKKPEIGVLVDAAMDAIEKENSALKGVLPKVYARENLDPASLGALIDLVSGIALGDAKARSADVLGHVFEYFLGEFALAEGKKGGQFYTPRSIVELLVAMLEPFKGRVMDPCCGSGGMFVQSEKFVREHQGRIRDISIYGQESNQTTWRLAKMNLAIRGIESSQVKWNNEGSFLNDALKDVRADYILANPPFNDSDWSGDMLRKDARWQYGVPPAGSANFAWLQHFAFHLAPAGQAGIVLAKGALTSKSSGEGEIRRRMIEEGNLIDCIVNLPTKLFLNTQIPAALWFLARDRTNHRFRNRSGEILFIDARNMGMLINRRTRELTPEDIKTISDTYHNWRNVDGNYANVKGFCASVPLAEVADKDYVLTPGRYVGLPDEDDDFDFAERFVSLQKEFAEQLEEEKRLNAAILESLGKVRI
ncbi:type I restriction-modification system subunit M [Bilophila wadsworthia]|uniref:type I restriction-modification system subunit M n=1 Tax=Bilophila wadsworthia TaxID=35833 RepID=UPI002432C56F|nr:class I SAM-dependent DNA methyltransferase [Bilophila wadsworthia]